MPACLGSSLTPLAPEVQLVHSSSCSPSNRETVELICLVTGFSPPELQIDWLIDGRKAGPTFPAIRGPMVREEGESTYSVTSRVNVSKSDWSEGKSFTCQVKHPGTGSVVEDHVRGCEGSTQTCGPIQVFLLPPSPGDLYIGLDAKIRCLVYNLPSDSSLSITWSRDKQHGHLRPDPLILQEHYNGTYSASSSVPISTQDWLAGERFSCTVQHDELPQPVVKGIKKETGPSTPPHIYPLPPNPEELSLPYVTLTCLVRGFRPRDIEIRWLRDHRAVPSTSYVTTSVLPEVTSGNGGNGSDGETYFVYSQMRVEVGEWRRGTSYACMAVHEALPMRFSQRTLQKMPEAEVLGALCEEEDEAEAEGLWGSISVFVALFLLSVCYSATVTFLKVKWLFSTVLQLKQASTAAYCNVPKETI